MHRMQHEHYNNSPLLKFSSKTTTSYHMKRQ